jgi:hypothetical protein
MSDLSEAPEIPEVPIPPVINYQIISELNKRIDNHIKAFKKIIRILGTSIRRNQRPEDNTDLLSQLQYIDDIYQHINDPKPDKDAVYAVFLEELLYYYEKKIDISNRIYKRVQSDVSIVTILISKIAMYDLNNVINKYIYNEAAVLTLLQSISFIDDEINIYTSGIDEYNAKKSESDSKEALLLKQMLDDSVSKEEKMAQINEYYNFLIEVEYNSILYNDVDPDIIRFLESVKTDFSRKLSDLTTDDIQSILKLKISSPLDNQTQQDIITLLNYYWVSKEALKTGVQTEETMLEEKEIELRIKKNIELLCETLLIEDNINIESLNEQMVGNQSETPSNLMEENGSIEMRDMSKKPNTLENLPEQIKTEIRAKYEDLFKMKEKENRKQEKIINELISLQRAKKELDTMNKQMDELSESVAMEIMSQNWNSLDLFYINELINQRFLPSLSKLSYDIVKAVKIKVVELLGVMISEKIKLSINNELTEATKRSDMSHKSWDDASKRNKPLSESEQLELEKLKTEFDVAYKIVLHLQREKTRIMSNIDEYIGNWSKKQIGDIKGVGFGASLVSKPEEIQPENPDICAIIETTREKVKTANYFPLQFPTLV